MKYFKETEFKCPCGCGMGYKDMDEDLIDLIDYARDLAGAPFIINSAIRCPAHNKVVGGSPTSSHLAGKAVDIACSEPKQRFNIIRGLVTAGFDRIGVAPNFIHADVDTKKSQEVLWVYK